MDAGFAFDEKFVGIRAAFWAGDGELPGACAAFAETLGFPTSPIAYDRDTVGIGVIVTEGERVVVEMGRAGLTLQRAALGAEGAADGMRGIEDAVPLTFPRKVFEQKRSVA